MPGEPNGIILVTFTPLWGMTELAKDFIQAEEGSPKKLITATWDDAPHLSPTTRTELYKLIPPHEREARTEGRPMLGSGAVYPVPEADIVVADFELPAISRELMGWMLDGRRRQPSSGAAYRGNDTWCI